MSANSSTEQRNPATVLLDAVDTRRMLEMILAEDFHAVTAVAAVTGQLAEVVDEVTLRLARDGTVHYFGAGASGRLAMLDATEMTPTFGVRPELFQAHFPGGAEALLDSTIDLEDADALGYQDASALDSHSVAVGISASGKTPYVRGALRRAREVGSLSVVITCNPRARLREYADVCVVADTGPEALMGSTRLKAGTATKVILSAFSTALMVRAGHTYSNLMVGLSATNDKLRDRAVAILAEGSSKSIEICRETLKSSGDDIPIALIMLISGCALPVAQEHYSRSGTVRGAVDAISELDR